jgi:hypothetical protein
VARAGVWVLALAAGLVAGAAATAWAAVSCGQTITALAANARDTAIFLKLVVRFPID